MVVYWFWIVRGAIFDEEVVGDHWQEVQRGTHWNECTGRSEQYLLFIFSLFPQYTPGVSRVLPNCSLCAG